MLQKKLSFWTICAGLSIASIATAGPLKNHTGTRPATKPPAQTATTTTSSQKSGTELLTLSAAALAKTDSYQYAGSAKSTVTGASGAAASKSLNLSGAWQKPSKVYNEVALIAVKGQAGGKLETYTDGTALYVKVTGAVKSGSSQAGHWVKSTQPISTQGNPFTNLALASEAISSATVGENTTLNGKSYLTVVAVLNDKAAKAVLANLLTASGVDVAGAPSGSLKAQASVTYYIDPKTYLAEVARFSGTETVSAKSGATTVKVDGDTTLKGANQPVTMPDVSGASSAKGSTQQQQ
jgi:hypothetical protein